MKKKTLTEIIYDIYRELYMNAEPTANFDELCENAEIDDEGRKVIHYMDYEIDEELMKEILAKHYDLNKLSKEARNAVSINVYLGCSPRSKRKNKEE